MIDKENFEFDFEKLEVYKLALEFLDYIFEICKSIPKDLQYALGDNIRRAGISISNNIAEGSGKKSGKEKSRYYGTSLDSTRECANMFVYYIGGKQLMKTAISKAEHIVKGLQVCFLD